MREAGGGHVFLRGQMNNQFDVAHLTGQAISLAGLISYFIGWLPAVAATIAAIFYILQIWEMRTVTEWRERYKRRHKAEKILRLKAQEKVIAAQLEALELKRSAASTAAEVLRAAEVVAADKVAAAASAAKIEQVRTQTEAAVKRLDQ